MSLFDLMREWWRAATAPPAVPSTDAEMHAAERDIDEDVIEACGKLAIAELMTLWKLDIFDPRHTDHSPNADRCRRHILDIITNGGGWRWITEYTGDGSEDNEQWCGFTQAWAWKKWIAEETRKTWWASTYRLDAWASYGDLIIGDGAKRKVYPNRRPARGQVRLYGKMDEHSTKLPFIPQVGDLLLVGDGKPAYGDHICGVRGWDPARKMFLTVEGNGVGSGPDGKKQHGLVIAERPLGKRPGHGYHACRLIRPSPADLLP